MKEEFLSQDCDTNECEILLRVGTKDREKGLKIGDEFINDLLSACSYTIKTYKGSPIFKKNLKRIEKQLRKCLT